MSHNKRWGVTCGFACLHVFKEAGAGINRFTNWLLIGWSGTTGALGSPSRNGQLRRSKLSGLVSKGQLAFITTKDCAWLAETTGHVKPAHVPFFAAMVSASGA